MGDFEKGAKYRVVWYCYDNVRLAKTNARVTDFDTEAEAEDFIKSVNKSCNGFFIGHGRPYRFTNPSDAYVCLRSPGSQLTGEKK